MIKTCRDIDRAQSIAKNICDIKIIIKGACRIPIADNSEKGLIGRGRTKAATRVSRLSAPSGRHEVLEIKIFDQNRPHGVIESEISKKKLSIKIS